MPQRQASSHLTVGLHDARASLASTQRQDHSKRVSSSRNSMLTIAADFEICLHSASEFTFGGTLELVPNFTL
jgi:hypothetical protein